MLVDVRNSYHRTILDTIEHYIGKRFSVREVHGWKNRPGYNDDWKLTHSWLKKLGCDRPFEEVKKKFQEIYWGVDSRGNVSREKWLLPGMVLARLGRRAELDLFTGRTREELDHTLDRFRVRRYFRRIVTVEDVRKPKPDPEGLLRVLKDRDPGRSLYIGDNVDDALAARKVRVPFLGVLPRGSEARLQRARKLRELGALAILSDIGELERWLRRTSHR